MQNDEPARHDRAAKQPQNMVEPKELVLRDVRCGQVYTSSFSIQNLLKASVDVNLKPSDASRLAVEPSSCRLQPGEAFQCTVRLKVLKFANKAKAQEQGQKDFILLKGSFFDQKIYCTWYLEEDSKTGAAVTSTAGQHALPPRPAAVSPKRSERVQAGSALAFLAALRRSTGSLSLRPPSLLNSSQAASAVLANARSAPAQHAQHGSGGSSPTLAPGSPAGSSSLDTRSSTTLPRPPLQLQPRLQHTLPGRTGTHMSLESFSFQTAAAGRSKGTPMLYSQQDGPRTTLSSSAPTSPVRQRVPAGTDKSRRADSGRSSSGSMSADNAAHSPAAGGSDTGSTAPSPPLSPDAMRAPLPRSPSLGLQAALHQLKPQSPSSRSRSTSPVRDNAPQVSKLPIPSKSLERSSSSSNIGNEHSQPTGVLATADESRRQAVARDDGRKAQIAASTAAIRAAFSNLVSGPPVGTIRSQQTMAAGSRGSAAAAITASEKTEAKQDAVASKPAVIAHQDMLLPAGLLHEPAGKDPTGIITAGPTSRRDTHTLNDIVHSVEHGADHILAAPGVQPEHSTATPAVPGTRGYMSLDMPASSSATNLSAQQPTQRFAALAGQSQPAGLTSRTGLSESLDAYRMHSEGRVATLVSRLQEAHAQQECLEANLHSQMQALQDKDVVIQVLQEQLAAAQQQLQAGQLSSRSSPAKGKIAAQVDDLQGGQSNLQAQIRELDAQVNRYRDEAGALRRMQLELQSRAPDAARLVEAAVAREQVLQEERNRKALELLLSKDQRIQQLEVQLSGLEVQAQQAKHMQQELQSQLQASQAALLQALRDKDIIRQEAQAERDAYIKQRASLQSELEAWQVDALAKAATEERAVAAEKALNELQSQLALRTQQLSECQQVVKYLQQQVAEAEATAATTSAAAGSPLESAQQVPTATAKSLLQPALEQRVLMLEAHNRQLQDSLEEARAEAQQLQSVATSTSAQPASSGAAQEDGSAAAMLAQFELQRLRDLLASRDQELLSLRTELAVRTATGQQQEAGDAEKQLAVQLADAQLQLQLAQERLAAQEARALLLAQTSSTDDELQQRLASAQSEARRARADADLARAASNRLNARVTQLCSLEVDLRSQLDTMRQALVAAEELHSREVAALEDRLQAAASANTKQERLGLEGNRQNPVCTSWGRAVAGSHAHGPRSDAAQASPAQNDTAAAADWRQVVVSSERAVAVMQARLLAALKGQVDARSELEAVKLDAQRECQALEAQVRSAQEEGALRIRTLEQALSRLSSARASGEQSVEVARVVADMEAAVRTQARQAMELQHMQGALTLERTQVQALQQQLAARDRELAESWVYSAYGPGDGAHQGPAAGGPASGSNGGPAGGGVPAHAKDGQSALLLDPGLEERVHTLQHELTRRQQLIAQLVQELEEAKQQLSSTQAEAARLRASLPNPALPRDVQMLDLKQKLQACEAELTDAKEQAAAAKLDSQRSAIALAEAERLQDASNKRVAQQELDLVAAQDAAARQAAQVHGALSSELCTLSSQLSDSQHQLAQARLESEQRSGVLHTLESQLAELRTELSQAQEAAQKATATAAADKAALQQELDDKSRELRNVSLQSEQRSAQVSVLMETIEALQAGSSSEQEQQLVALTAQLAAARARELQQEQRCDMLLHSCDAKQAEASTVGEQLTAARTAVARLEQHCASLTAQQQAMEQQLGHAREEARTHMDGSLHTARELSRCQSRCGSLEAEAEGLRASMRDMQARHVEQISREREEAAESLRLARNEAVLVAVRTGAGAEAGKRAAAAFNSKIQEPLQDLLVHVKRQLQQSETEQHQGAAWCVTAMEHMQAILLDLERQYQHAAADAVVYKQEAATSATRAHALAAALERRTSSWQVAEFKAEALTRQAHRRCEQATSYLSRLLQEQRSRKEACMMHLAAACQAEVAATGQLPAAQAQVATYAAEAAAHRAALAVAQSEVAELQARMTAAQLEAIADTQPDHMSKQLTAYLEQLVARLSGSSSAAEPRAKLLGLVRELAAVKQSLEVAQSHLAAARQQSDAARLSAQGLREAARRAYQELFNLQQQLSNPITQAAAASSTVSAGSHVVTPAGPVMGSGTAAGAGRMSDTSGAALVSGGQAAGPTQAQEESTGKDSSKSGALPADILAAVEAAERHHQQTQLLVSSLLPAVNSTQSRLTGLPPTTGSSAVAASQPAVQAHQLAKLRAQLVVSWKDLHAVQDQLAALQQALAARELDVSELQAGSAAQQLLLQQHKDEAALALLAQRQQLDAAHEADRQLLLRELSEGQARMVALRDMYTQGMQQAEAQLHAARTAVGQELDQAVGRALQGYVRYEELDAANKCAAGAERLAAELQAQGDVLQQQLSAEKAQVLALQQKQQITTAALSSLQDSLASIEAAASVAAVTASSAATTAGQARRKGSTAATGGSTVQGNGSTGALSKELVRAKLAEAEAGRKIRVLARQELELRQKLLQRDERITALKEQLAASGAGRRGQARSASPPRDARKGLRTLAGDSKATGGGKDVRSLSRLRGDVGRASARSVEVIDSSTTEDVLAAAVDASGRAVAGEPDVAQLSAILTQTRLQAARAQAENTRLQVELAAALASQPAQGAPQHSSTTQHRPAASLPPSLEALQTGAQLSTVNTALATSLATVKGLTRQLETAALAAGLEASLSLSPYTRHSLLHSNQAAQGSTDAPEPSQLPAALAAALQQLSSVVHKHTSRYQAGTPPESAAVVGQTGAVPSGHAVSGLSLQGSLLHQQDPGSTTSRVLSLQLEHAERRCKELQSRVETLAALNSDLETKLQQSQQESSAVGGIASKAAHEQHDDLQQQDRTVQDAAHTPQHSSSTAHAHRLLLLLTQSTEGLRTACKALEGMCLQPNISPSGLRQHSSAVVSELVGLEATISLLSKELQTPRSIAAVSVAAADQTGADAAVRLRPSRDTSVGGVKDQDDHLEDGPSFSFPPLSPVSTPAPSTTSTQMQTLSDSGLRKGGTTQQLPDDMTPVSTWSPALGTMPLDSPTASLRSAGLSHVEALNDQSLHAYKLPPSSTAGDTGDHVAARVTGDASATNLLAEKLLQQKERTDKWKKRARELGQQLALLGAGSAARDAAVAERVVAAERALEEQAARQRAEVNRLQAMLAGADAARRELEKLATGSSVQPSSRSPRARTSGASGGGSSNALFGVDVQTAATVAELRARCSLLEQQVEMAQAQAGAANTAVVEEAARLRSALAQEQGERVRLLGGMRDALAGLRMTGDVEGQLRAELLQAQQVAAAARSAQERAEAQAAARLLELQATRDKLQSVEQAHKDLLHRTQAQLNASISRCDRLAQMIPARVDELGSKLAATTAGLLAPAQSIQVRLQQAEQDIAGLQQQLADAVDSQALLSSQQQAALAAAAKEHEREVVAVRQELASSQQAAARQLADLQSGLKEAVARAEAAVCEVSRLQQQLAETNTQAHETRQQLIQQHLDAIQALQQQAAQEREAQQANARAQQESMLAACNTAAQASQAAALAELEQRYKEQLQASETAGQQLQQQLVHLEAAFRAFQQQKAAEIARLEERVLGRIAASDAAPETQSGAAAHQPGARVPANKRSTTVRSDAAHVKVGRPPANSSMHIARQDGHASSPKQGESQQEQSVAVGGSLLDGIAADVAEAAVADAAAAARRELLFEQLQRQRAEALLASARKTITALKTRLKLGQRQLEALQDSSCSAQEHQRVLQELEACKEALKACKQESAKRLRALQLLQGLASANLLQPGRVTELGAVMADAAHAQHNAPAAAQQPAQAAAVNPDILADAAANAGVHPIPAVTADSGDGDAASPSLQSLLDDAVSVATGMPTQQQHRQRPMLSAADSEGLFAQVASTAAAAASNAAQALEREQAARQAAETRLKEAQAVLSRRSQEVRELRQRVGDLETQLKRLQEQGTTSSQLDALQAQAAGLEAKLRQATAAVSRKDVLIRELKTQLDAATAQATSSLSASDQSQAERDARALTRLRAEVARKEVALQAAQAALSAEQAQLAEAHAAGDKAGMELGTMRAQLAAVQQRAGQVLAAVRDLVRLLLRSCAAASASAATRSGQGAGRHAAGGSEARSQGGGPLRVDDIASLTNLTAAEVAGLLGGDMDLSTNDDAGLRAAANQAACARSEALLQLLEATLLPAADQPAAGVTSRLGRASNSSSHWDVNNLRLLVQCAEQEVIAVEQAVGMAA